MTTRELTRQASPDDEIIVLDTKGRSLRSERHTGIHVSDRILFKRCRRKWHWGSPLRRNLTTTDVAYGPFWFGTGFHFALEDFHGHARFGTAADAFRVYCGAFESSELPDDYSELKDLGPTMLDYYQFYWLPRRSEFQTLFVDGVPQVEVDFSIKLPRRALPLEGTFDRVVVDPYKRLWVEDYKTAARYDSTKLETDPQVTAYSLAASIIYGRAFEGVLYTQFIKTPPRAPKKLVTGGFSRNIKQTVSYETYKAALVQEFGGIPKSYVDVLNELKLQETADGDRFIRRDLVRRNWHQQRAELVKILAETRDMLNPRLPLYPNPSRDCAWDCPFRVPCVLLDAGGDYESVLNLGYREAGDNDRWRTRIQYPYPPDLEATANKHNLELLAAKAGPENN